jgi:PmbA protein
MNKVEERIPTDEIEIATSKLADYVVSLANSDEEVEAYVAYGNETSIRVFNSSIETLESAETMGIGIRYIKSGKLGFAWSGQIPISVSEATFNLTCDYAREVFKIAKENSQYATYDEYVFLAEPDGIEPVNLNLFDAKLLEFDTSYKINLAFEIEKLIKAKDKRIKTVEQSNYGDGLTVVSLSSTKNIHAVSKRTGCYLAAYAIAGNSQESHTGGGVTVARNPGDLDPTKVVEDAVKYSTRMVGAIKPKSTVETVVFDPKITSIFLALLSTPFSGNSLAKKRSFLMDRLGETIAAKEVTLTDDPTNQNAYGAGIYDAEGLATRKVNLVENGKLVGFLHSTETAKRCKMEPTASATRSSYFSTPSVGPRALYLNPGNLTSDEILKYVDNGVYVQTVTGVASGVNPISGDFSVGIEGLNIKNGKLDTPIKEATISSTMQKMLLNMCCIGSDVNWLPGVASGQTVAISSMTVSGL